MVIAEREQAINPDQLAVWLSEDISLELRAVIQNVNHMSSVVADQNVQQTGMRSEQLHTRIDHILDLANKAGAIQDELTIRVAPPHIGATTIQAISEDLALERILLSRYVRRRAQALDLDQLALAEAIQTRVEAVTDNIELLEDILENMQASASR